MPVKVKIGIKIYFYKIIKLFITGNFKKLECPIDINNLDVSKYSAIDLFNLYKYLNNSGEKWHMLFLMASLLFFSISLIPISAIIIGRGDINKAWFTSIVSILLALISILLFIKYEKKYLAKRKNIDIVKENILTELSKR